MNNDFDSLIDRRESNSIKWTKYSDDVLPLWVADMDFKTPQPILDALREALNHGVLGYEMPAQPLLESLAERMQRLYGWEVVPGMITAVPGIVNGFNVAAKAACGPTDGVLMQPPVYFPFLRVHQNQGVTRQFAQLVRGGQGSKIQYGIDYRAFESALDTHNARTAMFLICSPHNPTGNVFSREQLSRLAEICLQRDVVMCSDEIHSELLLGDAEHIPLATLSSEVAESSITLVAASKTFNTAGLFCGFAIIPNPELHERYKRAFKEMDLHVNSLGLIASQAAFSGACDDWLEAVLAYLTANRDFLVAYLKEFLPEIPMTIPEATFLSWLDCNPLLESGRIKGSPFEFFLEKAKVALSDGAQFGPGGEGFVRLNFACPRALLEEALDRMRKALS